MSIQLKIPFDNVDYNTNENFGYWNYRVIKRENPSGEVTYGIYEVHYDMEGNLRGHSENPISIIGESIEDIKFDIENLTKSLQKDILTYQK
tara:strand:- start:42 stop:314 length:273 start_codon:yes stop_codon:yes gene_type:complete